jgi:hypothetical protein
MAQGVPIINDALLTISTPRPDLRRTLSCPQPRRGSDLQLLENILRLERSAEELSIIEKGGHDFASARDRDSSLQRPALTLADLARTLRDDRDSIGVQSRASSYCNSGSLIDGNDHTSRKGQSLPSDTLAIPSKSFLSGSWTQISAKQSEAPSTPPLLTADSHMADSTQEAKPQEASPGPRSPNTEEAEDSRRLSQSSFSKTWDQIADQIGEETNTFAQPGQLAVHTVPTRPESTDTFHEAQLAFKDFDGVHFSPDTEEYVELGADGREIRRISARTSSGSLLDVGALLRSPPPKVSLGAPPPDENMVYYPAPVPRMLNLPKRLSQLPAATMQARRRTQLMGDVVKAEARQSVMWPAQANLSEHSQAASDPTPNADNRRSMLNQRVSMANLPPQLRASVYFEYDSVGQEIEVKSESAVATLDSILNASATAPVNAFTDHPFAGDVRKSVYASGALGKRRSTVLLDSAPIKDNMRRRSNLGLPFRRSSTIIDNVIDRPQSSAASLAPERKVQQRRSTYSLGDELERVAETETYDPENVNENGEADERAGRRSLGHRKTLSAGDEMYHHDYIEEEEEEHEEEEYVEEVEDLDDHEVIFAQPSTLLAELQVRKAQQKSRSRTAATAFPNGMHSTLLQLDAVEEISRKNRKAKRVELAWEDPVMRSQDAAREADDDDVPLAMLYKPKDGNVARNKPGEGPDWQRPMGLMERRDLENNEPLSSRRRRLRGESPPRPAPRAHRQSMHGIQPTIQLTKDEDDENPEEATETLGQRAFRLKTKDKLDSALTDVAPKPGARPLSTFSDDVLSQFKGLDVADLSADNNEKPSPSAQSPTPEIPPEDETLGQRRARLQREREASGEVAFPPRPALHSTNSLADLLSANPIGQRTQNKALSPAQGTLLHANAQMQLKHKLDLSQTNFRSSSSMMHERPLVDANIYQQQANGFNGIGVGGVGAGGGVGGSGGLLGINAHQSRPRNGGFAGGMYNHSGQVIPTSTLSSPVLGTGMGNNGWDAPQLGQVQMMHNAGYGAMPGMTGMPGMPYGMGYGGNPMMGSPMMGMGGNVNMNMTMGMGMNGMNMGMMAPGMVGMGMGGAMVDPNLKPDQRNAIDRWRMGIDG